MGLPQENSFAKNNRIVDILEDAAQKIVAMGRHCHVIVINELHAAHQGTLDFRLSFIAPNLRMLGWPSGDALIWRRSM